MGSVLDIYQSVNSSPSSHIKEKCQFSTTSHPNETEAKGFKSGVGNDEHFREVIERLKEGSIKKGEGKYFITIA